MRAQLPLPPQRKGLRENGSKVSWTWGLRIRRPITRLAVKLASTLHGLLATRASMNNFGIRLFNSDIPGLQAQSMQLCLAKMVLATPPVERRPGPALVPPSLQKSEERCTDRKQRAALRRRRRELRAPSPAPPTVVGLPHATKTDGGCPVARCRLLPCAMLLAISLFCAAFAFNVNPLKRASSSVRTVIISIAHKQVQRCLHTLGSGLELHKLGAPLLLVPFDDALRQPSRPPTLLNSMT